LEGLGEAGKQRVTLNEERGRPKGLPLDDYFFFAAFFTAFLGAAFFTAFFVAMLFDSPVLYYVTS